MAIARKLSVIDTKIMNILKSDGDKVFKHLLKNDFLSRQLGVSLARITKHVDQLIDDGLVDYYDGYLHVVESDNEPESADYTQRIAALCEAMSTL